MSNPIECRESSNMQAKETDTSGLEHFVSEHLGRKPAGSTCAENTNTWTQNGVSNYNTHHGFGDGSNGAHLTWSEKPGTKKLFPPPMELHDPAGQIPFKIDPSFLRLGTNSELPDTRIHVHSDPPYHEPLFPSTPSKSEAHSFTDPPYHEPLFHLTPSKSEAHSFTDPPYHEPLFPLMPSKSEAHSFTDPPYRKPLFPPKSVSPGIVFD